MSVDSEKPSPPDKEATPENSELKRAGDKLYEQNHLNRLLLDSLPHPAMIINKQRRIVASNRVGLEVGAKIGGYCWQDFGHSMSICREHRDRLDPDDPSTYAGVMCHFCLADETLDTSELKRDQNVRIGDNTFDTYWVPLGHDDLYLHYAIDVTDRKRAEEALKLSEEKLRKAQRLEVMGRMAGGFAHEVRNPLNSLLALTDAISLELEDNASCHKYLFHIREQVDRLSKLMSEMLELGKPADKKDLKPVDLVSVCSSAIDLYCHPPENKASECRCAIILKHLNAEPITVLAERERLITAFRNMIENASQHSPEGGEIHLIIHEPRDGRCRVGVFDRGTGVSEEYMDRVFEPFFSTRRGGTGLGLSLVKSIIESYGGTVAVFNNAPPPGCTVEVDVPLAGSEKP